MIQFTETPDVEPYFIFQRAIIPPPFKNKSATINPTQPSSKRKKRRFKKGTVESPHPSMSIAYLEQLQKDNYVTNAGREFVKYEVDALLTQKREAKASRDLKDKLGNIPAF